MYGKPDVTLNHLLSSTPTPPPPPPPPLTLLSDFHVCTSLKHCDG